MNQAIGHGSLALGLPRLRLDFPIERQPLSLGRAIHPQKIPASVVAQARLGRSHIRVEGRQRGRLQLGLHEAAIPRGDRQERRQTGNHGQ